MKVSSAVSATTPSRVTDRTANCSPPRDAKSTILAVVSAARCGPVITPGSVARRMISRPSTTTGADAARAASAGATGFAAGGAGAAALDEATTIARLQRIVRIDVRILPALIGSFGRADYSLALIREARARAPRGTRRRAGGRRAPGPRR